jgi:hypothetical protein
MLPSHPHQQRYLQSEGSVVAGCLDWEFVDIVFSSVISLKAMFPRCDEVVPPMVMPASPGRNTRPISSSL